MVDLLALQKCWQNNHRIVFFHEIRQIYCHGKGVTWKIAFQ